MPIDAANFDNGLDVRLVFPDGNIFQHISCKKVNLLRHDTHKVAQAFWRNIADVHLADCDFAGLQRVYVLEQRKERGLTRSTLAHHGSDLALHDREVQLLKYVCAGTITEGYVFEYNVSHHIAGQLGPAPSSSSRSRSMISKRRSAAMRACCMVLFMPISEITGPVK